MNIGISRMNIDGYYDIWVGQSLLYGPRPEKYWTLDEIKEFYPMLADRMGEFLPLRPEDCLLFEMEIKNCMVWDRSKP